MVEVEIVQPFGEDPKPPKDNAELRAYRHREEQNYTIWVWVYRK